MFNNHQPDDLQPRSTQPNLKYPVVIIACAGGGLLVSFGLCGTAASFHNQRLSTVAITGLALFIASAVALLGGIIWLIVLAIAGIFRRS